jgi:hypothetical protein
VVALRNKLAKQELNGARHFGRIIPKLAFESILNAEIGCILWP